MQKHCWKRNYVQNHIKIKINIILLYGKLQVTGTLTCAPPLPYGHSTIFKFHLGGGSWGAREKAQGASAPCHPSSAAHAFALNDTSQSI